MDQCSLDTADKLQQPIKKLSSYYSFIETRGLYQNLSMYNRLIILNISWILTWYFDRRKIVDGI